MFVKVNGIGLFGINTYPVQVESSVERTAMPRFDLVGLPDVAVREAKERVRAAMKNSDFFFPTARITMNLSPADKKKEGTGFDLPILVALLLFGAEKLISALLGVKIMAITSANLKTFFLSWQAPVARPSPTSTSIVSPRLICSVPKPTSLPARRPRQPATSTSSAPVPMPRSAPPTR